MPLACSAYGDGGPKVIAVPTIVANQCGGVAAATTTVWCDGWTESASACRGCASRENRTAKNIRNNIVIVVVAGLFFCRISRHQSGSWNRIGSGNPRGGVRDDAGPSTNCHERKFLRIFFYFFSFKRLDGRRNGTIILCRYMYTILCPRACAEKKKPYAHSHSRVYTHARTSDTQRRESVYFECVCVNVRERVFICVCVCIAARAHWAKSVVALTGNPKWPGWPVRGTDDDHDTTTVQLRSHRRRPNTNLQRGCKRIMSRQILNYE